MCEAVRLKLGQQWSASEDRDARRMEFASGKEGAAGVRDFIFIWS